MPNNVPRSLSPWAPRRHAFVPKDGYSLVTWRQLWLEQKFHRFTPSIRLHRPILLGRADFRCRCDIRWLSTLAVVTHNGSS